MLSTGGTAKTLREAGLDVKDVADYTGHPEMMDGRVKTLHPKVHGGLLSIRNNAVHDKACADHGVTHIDMVCVNLYPFQATVAKGSAFPDCVENIDIGGPAMIRSGSKNHESVTVLTDPKQYAKVIEELKANGGCTSMKTRRTLAAAAYAHTSAYDSAIANWFAAQNEETPAVVTRAYELDFPLKYGCNPHQTPANIYRMSGGNLPFKVSFLFHINICSFRFHIHIHLIFCKDCFILARLHMLDPSSSLLPHTASSAEVYKALSY